MYIHFIPDMHFSACFFLQLTSEPPLFRVAAVRGSNEEDYLKNHVNSSFRKIYEVNLKEHIVPSLDEGVKHMLQG